MKQQLINEHDITKMMLNKINESKLVKESDYKLTDDALKDQEDKFREVVSPMVTFNNLNVSLKDKDKDNYFFWSGEFDNGISWQMSKNDGLVISADNVTIDDEELEILKKLKNYRGDWIKELSEKLIKIEQERQI